MVAFAVLQVSAYSRTVLTFVLKILTFVLVDSCFEFQMFFSCKYAALALPIRAFTSASDPPCSSMMLPKYVKVFTSSKSSPSIVIGLVHSVLHRRTLLFPLCILRPTAAEAVATLVVFPCICCCVWDRRARSSAKSRSSSCILDVHCIPCFPSDVDLFMIQSTTRRKS
uniref:Secreted protein n=1 Tax=Schistosoma curassoni TaxID=6186 RepID=A0A183KBV5_9TREM